MIRGTDQVSIQEVFERINRDLDAGREARAEAFRLRARVLELEAELIQAKTQLALCRSMVGPAKVYA